MLGERNNCAVFNCHSQVRAVVKFGVAHSQRKKRFILLLEEQGTHHNNSSFSASSQGVCRLKAKSSLRQNKMFCFECVKSLFRHAIQLDALKLKAKMAFFAGLDLNYTLAIFSFCVWFWSGCCLFRCVFVHILMVSCFLLLPRDEKLAFRAARLVRRNKNPACLSSPGTQGIGRARQKYVLDQITLYHFTPLRFPIKHADGLCPGPREYFFLAIHPVTMPT